MLRSRILLAAAITCAALSREAAAQRPEVDPVQVGVVAEKLGVTLVPSAPREIGFGNSATTMLAEPKKIVAYGIKGMHEGARVTITCVGPNQIHVEADEMEPTAQRASVVLKVGADGSLTPVPERPSAPKPPGK